MHRVDGLQGPDHHLELGDLSVVVEGDDVHPVDVLALQLRLELQDGVVAAEDFLAVAELGVVPFVKKKKLLLT